MQASTRLLVYITNIVHECLYSTYQTELANNGIFGIQGIYMIKKPEGCGWYRYRSTSRSYVFIDAKSRPQKHISSLWRVLEAGYVHMYYFFHQNGEHLSTTTVACCFNLVHLKLKLPSTHSSLSYGLFLTYTVWLFPYIAYSFFLTSHNCTYTGYVQLCDVNRKVYRKFSQVILEKHVYIKPGSIVALYTTKNINVNKPCIYFCCGVFLQSIIWPLGFLSKT